MGLTSIDHIVQVVPEGWMGSFVLFWRAVSGLVPQALETADPYGLVRSPALVSPDGSMRIALNTSEKRATATGRFASAYAGAGVHHIALATDDIHRAVRGLEHARAALLPIPTNYYDDLSARWALGDAALAGLQQHALLYDRDGQGEFWPYIPKPSRIASSSRRCSARMDMPASAPPMPLCTPRHRPAGPRRAKGRQRPTSASTTSSAISSTITASISAARAADAS